VKFVINVIELLKSEGNY